MTASLVALVLATLVLASVPGPNAALIVANTLGGGLRAGVVTVLGTTVGVASQLILVVIGLAALIEFASQVLDWFRWAGVAYLLWLGIRTWRAAPGDAGVVPAERTVFWRACLVAAANPKTLLFNAAFLPQFLGSDATASEIMVVALVFITALLFADMLWAVFANSARRLLIRFARVRNKLSGGLLVAAATGLAAAHRDA